ILTGTPAGSTVVQPGDIIEVEVDGNGHSTGRLRTQITEGTEPLADYGAQPRVDDTQRAEAWGSAGLVPTAGTAVGAGVAREGEKSPSLRGSSALSDEMIERINSVGTATLSVQLRKRGINTATIEGLRPT